jgi:1,4-alpha-glucan branching enzyme
MTTGYLSLVLHAHLPFVRHPEDATVMEEGWLYEAITETYLPILQICQGLAADQVPFRLTISLSAPLISMLDDDLLRDRYERHLEQLLELAEKEIVRTRNEPQLQNLTRTYRKTFQRLQSTWKACNGQLLHAFRELQESGHLEVITSTATHAFFPLMDRNWAAMRAQVHVAADLYEKHFGQRPAGMWLGECGYVPGVEELLREAAVRYFFIDTHGILFADPPPRYGVHAPLYCPNGVAVFGRDPQTSQQVWSSHEGYPGDPRYRDFYRDIGFDLPMDYIAPYIHPAGIRTYTGLKYYAITHHELHDKRIYDPQRARQRVGLHASHFRHHRHKQLQELAGPMDLPPLIVSPYDAELFGHWWYEGPLFLGDVLRQLHFDQEAVEMITPGQYLDRHPTHQVASPCASSWGQAGYNEYWLNESNAWVYQHLHHAAERMVQLARENPAAQGVRGRALRQAARELLLAQSSDWAFIMKTGTTVAYAERRTNEHVLRFRKLDEELSSGNIDAEGLAELEAKDNLFPDLNYEIYAS